MLCQTGDRGPGACDLYPAARLVAATGSAAEEAPRKGEGVVRSA